MYEIKKNIFKELHEWLTSFIKKKKSFDHCTSLPEKNHLFSKILIFFRKKFQPNRSDPIWCESFCQKIHPSFKKSSKAHCSVRECVLERVRDRQRKRMNSEIGHYLDSFWFFSLRMKNDLFLYFNLLKVFNIEQ